MSPKVKQERLFKKKNDRQQQLGQDYQGEWDRVSVTCPSKEQDLALSVMGNLWNLWKGSGVSELVVSKTTWVYTPDEMCYVKFACCPDIIISGVLIFHSEVS